MRSSLVFRAQEKVVNRFELCLLVSRSARVMNNTSTQMHDVINNAFSVIGRHCGLFSSLGPLVGLGAEAEHTLVEQVQRGESAKVTELENSHSEPTAPPCAAMDLSPE